MKTILTRFSMLLILFFLGINTIEAQGRLIRKIQQKAEDKIIEDIFNDSDKKETETLDDGTESSSSTRHRKGGGLSQDTPDVLQYISDAENAFEAQKFSEAKSAIRQALWGVELGIGHNILNSLPDDVEGLKKNESEDRVSSTGIGFVGLVIERVYQGSDDMELRASIGNDSGLLGLAGMYMAEGMYQTTDDANHKQIRFQEHRAYIEYNDDEGYTLGVPFGQSSVFVLIGSNFDSEKDFLSAANKFDIEKIKKELGE
jgi:hypothetical protein